MSEYSYNIVFADFFYAHKAEALELDYCSGFSFYKIGFAIALYFLAWHYHTNRNKLGRHPLDLGTAFNSLALDANIEVSPSFILQRSFKRTSRPL